MDSLQGASSPSQADHAGVEHTAKIHENWKSNINDQTKQNRDAAIKERQMKTEKG